MVRSMARPAGAPRTSAARNDFLAVEPAAPERSTACLVTANDDGPRRELLDLLAASVTAVTGQPGPVAARLWAMAGEASSGAWSPPCAVVTVGVPGAGTLPGVRTAEDPGQLARELAREPAPDGRRRPSILVVGSRRPDDRAGLTALEQLVRAEAGLALVVAGPWPAANFTVEAAETPSPGDPGTGAGSPAVAGERVEIAILGPVQIRGASGSFARRPKLTELVVYLALHPEGASTAKWAAALWPNRLVPDQTVANRLSEARRAVGFASDGRPRLRKEGDRHQLVEIESDWQRFRQLADPEGGPVSWHAALDLVRGRPFEGLFERQWCTLEGLLAEVELDVVDCGLRLGRELLRSGDPEGAQWAATRTLKACPFDERVHRLLMRAADAGGNRAGVKEAFRQLTLMLEIDGDPRLGVHPQTAALYTRLAEEPASAK